MNKELQNFPLARFDLVTLRIFLTVIDTGSIRSASESLNLSPSAISRRLAELEENFGQPFFARHSRGVEISDAGHVMAAKAREIFAAIDSAHSELRRLSSGEAGSLLLSANGSAFVNGLAEDMKHFSDAYPYIGIELFEQISPNVVASVVSGRTELGLISRTFRLPPEIVCTRYCTDRLVLAVPEGHDLARLPAVRLSDMSSYPSIGVIEGSSMTRLIRRVSVLGSGEVRYRYMANTNEVARTLVAHGHGIAILPEQFVRPHEAIMPIKAVPIDESWAEREISLVQHGDATLSKTAAIFREFLLERSRERGEAG